MKTLKLLTIILPLSLLLLAGCSSIGNNSITPALVRLGVSTGVTYGAMRYPQAVPGIRIAGEAICSAAASTNLSPQNVIDAIQGAGPDLSTEATLIINGALVLYTGIYNAYGADAVNKHPELKLMLLATCDGIKDGLGTPASPPLMETKDTAWPLLRAK